MKLNETEVNNYLRPYLGWCEDSFQQAWVDILESDPQTLEEITPIIRRVRFLTNKKGTSYLRRVITDPCQYIKWG